MTAVLPERPTRAPARPAGSGRHRAPEGGAARPVTGFAGTAPAGLPDRAWDGDLEPTGLAGESSAPTAPFAAVDLLTRADRPGADPATGDRVRGGRSGRSRHAAPTQPFTRAARTAGLSLAALGALATAGGVASHGFGADEPTATGELAAPSLAAQDLALRPAQASVPQAPAVLPAAAAPTTAVAAPKPTTSTAAPTTTAAPAAAASTLGEEAVAAARTRLGKPYVWGATGPNSFDCSGLMQWAYKQAGKSLPRVAAAQASVGTSVSVKNLQPGDMVFFYSPISHVAMYVGNGMVIEAPTEGENVKLTKLSSMSDVVAARHVG